MEIEVGKYYRNQKGEIRGPIVATQEYPDYPYKDNRGYYYTIVWEADR